MQPYARCFVSRSLQRFRSHAVTEPGCDQRRSRCRRAPMRDGSLSRARSRFDLPGLDVFEIDARVTPPTETASFAPVGTVLFNMLVNPASGSVYVSNTEARNEVRFEGPDTMSSTVRGHLHEARLPPRSGGLACRRPDGKLLSGRGDRSIT